MYRRSGAVATRWCSACGSRSVFAARAALLAAYEYMPSACTRRRRQGSGEAAGRGAADGFSDQIGRADRDEPLHVTLLHHGKKHAVYCVWERSSTAEPFFEACGADAKWTVSPTAS